MACSCVKLVPGVRCVYNWAWHGVGLNLYYIYGRGVCPSACNSIHIGLMLDYTCAWNDRSMHESTIPFLTRHALSIVSDQTEKRRMESAFSVTQKEAKEDLPPGSSL